MLRRGAHPWFNYFVRPLKKRPEGSPAVSLSPIKLWYPERKRVFYLCEVKIMLPLSVLFELPGMSLDRLEVAAKIITIETHADMLSCWHIGTLTNPNAEHINVPMS